jgi:signal transduction histidine kinase
MQVPTYAVFDDYRYSQRIAVVVRWFLLATWLSLINYRPDVSPVLFVLNGMGLLLAVVNGYVHWRMGKGRPITKRYVLALSIMDLAIITAGVGMTSRFGNTFFVLYYPALLGLSLVFSSRRLAFSAVALVAGAYVGLSITMEPGVSYAEGEEKTLILRVVTMFAVVAAANLMTRIERTRRREAVDAERAQAERNLALQRMAQDAEHAAQEERDRIAREIHDGIAQSVYALTLSLETCAELAGKEKGPIGEQLQRLVPLAKNTLLETRHYIFDLKPLLSGESDLVAMAQNQVNEYGVVSGMRVRLSANGAAPEVSLQVASGLYRILQESLANILKHSNATEVVVGLAFESGQVRLSVQDDGDGFDVDGARAGYGLQNMRERAGELDGGFEISSAPGRGTKITVTLPAKEVTREAHQGADSGRPRGGAPGA